MSIWNLFAGYGIIEIKGGAAERLINLIVSEHLDIWSIKRISATCIRANVSVGTFFRIRRLLGQQTRRCQVKLIQKKGFLFKLSALRERKLFALGWVAMLALLIILSGSLWRIRVTGCDILDEKMVLSSLYESGVSIGMRTAKLNTMTLANKLCTKSDKIAFASVALKGVSLYVDIKEVDQAFEQGSSIGTGSIYAKKDGVVKQIIANNGLPLYNAGDAVKRGDELISCTVSDSAAPVKAEGIVLAQVLYKCEANAGPLIETIKRSGRSLIGVSVYITDGIYLSTPSGYIAEESEPETYIELNGFFLPLKVKKEKIYELTEDYSGASDEVLIAKATAMANAKLMSILPQNVKLLSKQTSFEKTADGGIIAKIIATTLEDIGTNER